MKIKWKLGIGFSGAEGTGKTTLVKEVSRQLEVPAVLGVVRDVLKGMGLATPPTFGTDADLALKFQKRLFEKKSMEEKFIQAPFLADRTSIDMFSYTLSSLGRESKSQDFLKQYYQACVDYARLMYHFHFFVPTGRFAIEDDGVRNTLQYNATMMHYIILGMLCDLHLPFHIIQSVDLQDRIDEVIWVLHTNDFIE